MHFVVQYSNKTDANNLREAFRPQHIAYRKNLGKQLVMAGPLLNNDMQPVGSLIIIGADSIDDARELAQNDPYVVEGASEISSVTAYRIMAINPPE